MLTTAPVATFLLLNNVSLLFATSESILTRVLASRTSLFIEHIVFTMLATRTAPVILNFIQLGGREDVRYQADGLKLGFVIALLQFVLYGQLVRRFKMCYYRDYQISKFIPLNFLWTVQQSEDMQELANHIDFNLSQLSDTVKDCIRENRTIPQRLLEDTRASFELSQKDLENNISEHLTSAEDIHVSNSVLYIKSSRQHAAALKVWEKSIWFTRCIVMLLLTTQYFEWQFLNTDLFSSSETGKLNMITILMYVIGVALNNILIRYGSSFEIFMYTCIALVIYQLRTVALMFVRNSVVFATFSIVYPIIVTNFIRLFFSNLRIYVQPIRSFIFRCEKYFMFHGIAVMHLAYSIVSIYSIMYSQIYIFSMIVITNLILFLILYRRYYLLLDIVYRNTQTILLRI